MKCLASIQILFSKIHIDTMIENNSMWFGIQYFKSWNINEERQKKCHSIVTLIKILNISLYCCLTFTLEYIYCLVHPSFSWNNGFFFIRFIFWLLIKYLHTIYFSPCSTLICSKIYYRTFTKILIKYLYEDRIILNFLYKQGLTECFVFLMFLKGVFF